MLYAHPQGNVFYRKMDHARPQISHGEGVYLYDQQGKKYLDGSGGPLVVNVGHGRQEVIEAIQKQLAAVAYVHAVNFTSEPMEQYARELAQVVPMRDARFYLVNSGSEAVEGALKLARQIQMARGENGRYIVICRTLSYHGMTLGALSVSGRAPFRTPYLSMMQNMPHIRHPYSYRYPTSGEELASRLEESILAYGPENVSAFIAEPISGASLGGAIPPHDYWPRISAVCRKYGVLFIADEVLVGFGRTGKWWGVNHWAIEPDIMVSSKGMAGGYFPLGFLAGSGKDVEQIRSVLGDFNHGGTFSHHAVGAAAGLATLRIIQRENLVENSAKMGKLLGQKLREQLNGHPHVGDIRGRGLFWGIELVADRETKTPFPKKENVAWRITQAAFERGLIVYYSQGCADGVSGDLVIVGPPLIINEAQIDELVEILLTAIYAVI
jgi:adenosylmethionine-8-amino-7-oxononanoate aminotransferase